VFKFDLIVGSVTLRAEEVKLLYLGTTRTMNNGGGIEVLDGEGLKERCAER
jgi:hypothetical protein